MTPLNTHDSAAPLINTRIASDLADVNTSGLLGYRSHALPTWCPGCGYYGIAHGLTLALKELAIPNENLVVVSGIGCAGRLPFFVNGYGFHTIHGRALPIASGVKMANPGLTVIAVGGDGDGFGIGGGHIPHVIRRNVDMTYIVFDNSIYGLTKGQASPTTPRGQITSTSPFGSVEDPIDPVLMVLAYGASFIGTGFAGHPDKLAPVFRAALSHKGFSMIIITTPCITFDHVNVTYDRYRDLFESIPENHDPADFQAAMNLVMSGRRFNGIIFRTGRPTWAERQDAIQREAALKS